MSQDKIIESAIKKYISEGYTNKSEIYTMVVNDLDVPRPNVRRVASELKIDFTEKGKTE